MMIGALGASALASVWGLLGGSGQVVGGIALVPGIIAYFAVALKPEGRARWHHTVKNGLNALRRRLVYQMPNRPNADQVALIASLWTELDNQVHEDAVKYFSPNWTLISKAKTSDHENDSSS
jgi:hypothetical protein